MAKEKDKKILTQMQFEIGEITRNEDDIGFAKMFYREAAEKGDADAQNNLAVTYEKAGDYDKALFWYKQAVEAGSIIALVNLGKMYQYGRGTKVDVFKASEFYNRAVNKKFDDGYNKLGELYSDGLLGKEDKLKAVRIFLDGAFNATNGGFLSAFQAGYYYEYGLGVEQSYEKAKYLYEKSAKQGNRVAHYNLGQIYLYGHGVEKDLEKAIYHYLESAKLGYLDAMYSLAFVFYDNENIKRNNDVAMFWFTYGAEKGHLRSMLASGEMWLTGEICNKNKKAAFNVIMDFLTTVETDDEELIDEYQKLRKQIDDSDFWKRIDYAYDDYYQKHHLVKIGGDPEAQA